MMRMRWLAFWLVLGLAACADREPDLQPLAPDDIILAFGDSLTYGTGANAEQSYPAVLARLSGHEVINGGVPGELSTDGMKRLPSLLRSHRPALVILIHGGNDLLRKRNPESIKGNLRDMIRLIRGQGAQVMLVAVPRPALLLSGEPLYAEVASEEHVPLEADALAHILQSRELKSDAIHPNAEGYARLAKSIHRFLKARQGL